MGTITTGFSARTVPWMKLGKLVDEATTAAQAAKLGGIDFAVKPLAAYYRNGPDREQIRIPGRKVLVREDTGAFVSIVSDGYPIVQYADAFDFMDGVSPRFVAAGALRKGKQAFMVVETDNVVDLGDGDTMQMYGVLRTSHDCSRGVEFSCMPLVDPACRQRPRQAGRGARLAGTGRHLHPRVRGQRAPVARRQGHEGHRHRDAALGAAEPRQARRADHRDPDRLADAARDGRSRGDRLGSGQRRVRVLRVGPRPRHAGVTVHGRHPGRDAERDQQDRDLPAVAVVAGPGTGSKDPVPTLLHGRRD